MVEDSGLKGTGEMSLELEWEMLDV